PLASLLSSSPLPPLHSFPTRRSSDLAVLGDIRPDIVFLLFQLQCRRTCLPTAARYAEQVIAQSEGKPDRTRLHRRIIPNPACQIDRKSTRLNSSHVSISYAVFCLKKK